jgi:regulator of cell morphogenesis and NO signaling
MALVQPQTDWEQLSLVQLVDHIELSHHAWMRRRMPRILRGLDQLAATKDPRILRLRELFELFKHEMDEHMAMEERVVFPVCRRLGRADVDAVPSLRACLKEMIDDHDDGGALLLEMRRLSDDFTPPVDADRRLAAVYRDLREMAQNLREHVYKENCLVAFKAEQAQQQLLRSGA